MAKAKTNDPLATRRLNNPVKPEKVRDAKEVKGAHEKAVKRQNENDGDPTSLNVIPNRRIPSPPSTRSEDK